MVSMAIASMWASMASWFTPTILFCAANLIIATIYIASNNQTKHHDHDHDHDHHHEDHNNNNNNIPPTRMSRVSSFLDRARSFRLPYYSTTTIESQPQYESKTATYSSTSRLAQSIHLPSNESLYTSEPETYPLSQPAHSPPSFLERVKSMKFSTEPINSPGQLTRAPSFLERVRSFRFSSGSTQQETPDPNPNLDPGHNPDHHVIRSKSENTKKVKKKKKLPTEIKKSRSEIKMAASLSDDDEDDIDSRRPATARVRGSKDVDEEVDAKADDFISRFKQQLKLQRLESLVRYNQMINRGS